MSVTDLAIRLGFADPAEVEAERACWEQGHRLTQYGANFHAVWCDDCARTVRDDYRFCMSNRRPAGAE
jgi:hypothetical protein